MPHLSPSFGSLHPLPNEHNFYGSSASILAKSLLLSYMEIAQFTEFEQKIISLLVICKN